jgi:hypothetical protein
VGIELGRAVGISVGKEVVGVQAASMTTPTSNTHKYLALIFFMR